MTGGSVSRRNEKTSVKLRSYPVEGAFVDLANFDNADIPPSGNDNSTLRNCDSQSSEVLSTADLISAVGNAWNRARKPLSAILSKSNCTYKTEVIQGDGVLNYSTNEETLRSFNSTDTEPCSCNLISKVNSSRLVQGHLKVKQKIILPRPRYDYFSFWRTVLATPTMIEESYSIPCTEIPPNIESIYRWMAEIAPTKRTIEIDSVKIESRRTSNCHTSEFLMNSGSGVGPTDTISTFNRLTASKSNPAEPLTLPFSKDLNASTMTCSVNNIVHGGRIDGTDCQILASRCDLVSQAPTNLASVSLECENSTKESRDCTHEHEKDHGVVTFNEADFSEIKIILPVKKISPYALAKQEHAFAGAMAGVFVSLCLHPMDTIKTVIQSRRSDRMPLHGVGRSIIAERGMTGLYRGISSNIVTSAPISAVYTFTYESVKKSLLPLLPKEHHSLAHCTAGGCASIATSFIFTPSERIKQQMQIGSHYRNCWSAFIQVVQKGGVLSLYAGWGAVLCRNVPHSIIKFYTYESLKQIMLPSTKSNAQANLVATLLCGGLAGSMASLFTTPFDVVKTRLQTQIPGSMATYTGVFNTLTDIGKQEGLKGLYRGLTPRLVMYMIQGALFFASYESFKRLFSLEVSQQLPSARTFIPARSEEVR